MAQRDKEETELKVPETLSLCVNNCGFAGNPATNNMCQNCFKASTSNGILTPLTAPPKGKPGSTSIRSLDRSDETTGFGSREKPVKELQKTEGKAAVARREVNRCTSCQRRVGLTGFRCRCGDLFCSEHRYSDRHVCSYDYKAAGREAIARENPMVRAAKIIRV